MHARSHIYFPADLGGKAADTITAFVGSWLFVGLHTLWFGAWILARIEPFPFGLLTLMVSLEAIFLSTFVMMSQNRGAVRDHLRDDHEAEEVDQLFQLNQQQMEILYLLQPGQAQQDRLDYIARQIETLLANSQREQAQVLPVQAQSGWPGGTPVATNTIATSTDSGLSPDAFPYTIRF